MADLGYSSSNLFGKVARFARAPAAQLPDKPTKARQDGTCLGLGLLRELHSWYPCRPGYFAK